MVMSLVTILVGLVAQRIFINTLGTEYLGINGLFTSIVSMLALAELGLGYAVYYHLYTPLANNDSGKIKSIIGFYKISFRYIAVTVLLLGACLVPFLSVIVGDVNINESIYVIYILFLADIVFSYLFSYKRAVLYADQNNHIISMVHLGYLIVLNATQIIALIVTKNYYLYLLIKVAMRLTENIVLTFISNNKYPYLKERSIKKLDQSTKSEILKKVRGLAFHKVGAYVILGTDNIIISIFFGITTVGLYSNYYLVIGAITMIVTQVFTAITASVGNLLVKAKSPKSYEVYIKLRFGNFWLATFSSISLLIVMDSFITIWIGEQFLLPFGVLLALTLNLYSTLIRASMGSFKDAAGIFHQDRFVPILESIANIVFSIVLLQMLGLAGVFLGTVCSALILHLYSYPKFVIKPIFKQSYSSYYKILANHFFIAVMIATITYYVSRLVTIDSNLMTFIINILICLTIPNIILFVIFRNSKELAYYKDLVFKSTKALRAKL